jgi:hypothetical protein
LYPNSYPNLRGSSNPRKRWIFLPLTTPAI